MKVDFSRQILKNTQKSYFREIRLVGKESFHADGEADKYDDAIRRVSQFCERAFKKSLLPLAMLCAS